MKIILTTVYEGVTHEWLEWYFKELESKGGHAIVRALREESACSFTSTDPTDPKVSATTTYVIEK